MSTYNLLLGGYRSNYTYISFEPSTAKIKVIKDTPAPKQAAWIEPSVTQKGSYFSLSEEDGLVFSLGLKEDGSVVKGGERKTNGGPAHVHAMKDGSGIVAANYEGGSIIFFPTDPTSTLSTSSSSPNLEFEFLYKDKKAPNTERQDTPHPHQVIEGEGGKLYVSDLGNDRIWIVKRDEESGLEVDGWLQANEGAGPRHAAFSTDGKLLYVLTELHNSLLIFDLTTDSKHPLPETETSIIPPNVPKTHSPYMTASELLLNPAIPRVLYAANRLELQIPSNGPSTLPPIPKESGDAIAILLLNEKGDRVEEVKHVRTGCDNARGMQISGDGKYVAVAGQDGGGLEIWSVGGERGDVWKLAAKEEGLEGVNDMVWV